MKQNGALSFFCLFLFGFFLVLVFFFFFNSSILVGALSPSASSQSWRMIMTWPSVRQGAQAIP